MHIGFDVSQTGSGKAGCGYFAHAMVQAILDIAPQNNYSLYPSFGDFYFDPLMPVLNPYSGRNVQYGPRHLTREKARAFWAGGTLDESLGEPDIIHSNNFWSPEKTPSGRLVYTFYDMGFLVDPSWTTEANRLGCFEGVFRSSISADWVVAISEASRAHYLKIFPHFSEDRIRVVYPCSRFADSSATGKHPKALEGLPAGGFLLNVGTIEPRKNQRRLTEAYARYLAQGGAPMPLVLAGGKGWLMEDFQKHLSALGIKERVVMTGYVTDDELIWLYRNCYANLYPSLFEGFGLPVLEGMQFGAPTITTTSSSVPEVAGNAAILLDPADVDAWAQAMLRLTANRNERDALSAAAIEQAGRFDWRVSATALLQLYDEALASPKRRVAQ
ncbi:glycosyltransferase family 4 protein [Paraburkholderia dinghuensis]|uniref:Glycosyltransferase family 1 protein n=1 Tax=Paraburkholderia dinghuensis TaxID=2305225 RepID=A0A3N6NH46_9BURK|nr:glycosyltransferase family 1 protein [Paraburkholderia dinghuensis]RQH08362.1 glycosyltransferase family 1 protein [Paraburkholderia dinghuensis]